MVPFAALAKAPISVEREVSVLLLPTYASELLVYTRHTRDVPHMDKILRVWTNFFMILSNLSHIIHVFVFVRFCLFSFTTGGWWIC